MRDKFFKNFFLAFSFRLFLCGLLTTGTSCTSPTDNGSEVLANTGGFQVTGRKSMGDGDPFQCSGTGSYSGPEKVNGRWIAGVDGTTLRNKFDATSKDGGPGCGGIFTLSVNGRCEEFIVADRVWENDGSEGYRYDNKGEADRKGRNTGAGYPQLDIAKIPFKSLFNDQNASSGFDIAWNASCGGGSRPGPSQAPPSDFAQNPGQQPFQGSPSPSPSVSGPVPSGCSYADAAKHQGWGWNPTTQQSCDPLQPGQSAPLGPSQNYWGNGNSQVTGERSCASGNRFCSGGWGWENPGENQCGPGHPGWKQNGCSCRC